MGCFFKIINIELQLYTDEYWISRSILYLCRAYDSIKEGDNYSLLKPTTHICITDKALIKNNDWSFEKEWRLISIDRPDIYQHLKIQAIYFGLKTAEVDKRLILQFNKDYNLGIDIYQMTFNNVKFEAKKII